MGRLSSTLVRAQQMPARSTVNRIHSLRIAGGFLDGLNLELTDQLNCVIGPRGAGKTTVLELIRYALDDLPRQGDGERTRIENLIKANLGDGQIELTLETREGLRYRVHRTWQEEPVVLTADGAATEITLRAGGVFRANIYSQNEVERIADQALSQLSLLDNFESVQIAQIGSEIRTLTSKLATNATTLVPLQDQIAVLNEEIASLPGIEEKLKAMAPVAGPNGEALTKAQQAKSLRQREGQSMDGLWQLLGEFDQQVEGLEGHVSGGTAQWTVREILAGANGTTLTAVRQMMLDGAADIDESLRQIRSRVGQMQARLTDFGASLSGAHAQQEVSYQELLARDTALRGQATERNTLDRMKNDLLAKQQQRSALIDKQTALLRERQQMLKRLSELRDKRYGVRADIARRINDALMPVIRVTIEAAGHTGQYREILEEALKGARLKQGIVAQRIVERIASAELVAAVRQGDAKLLAQRAGINEEQARKVVDTLKETEILFDLETVELADRPRIELKDGESYKESSSLSTGQKCTTILPILLLDSDNPLLVDQPEDNLDNRFICESVVESIRKVKADRQLVFVTHNPNIPVLADAERVFVLESDGAHAGQAAVGNVDECRDAIVNLLEGGEQAFKRRRERYAYP